MTTPSTTGPAAGAAGDRRKENRFILVTDIIGHTKMFGRVGAAFRPMRERHDELFWKAIRDHGSHAAIKGTGDGFYAAFEDVNAAIETVLAFRRALVTEDWDRFLPQPLRVPENHIRCRLGVHSGLVNVFYQDGKATDIDGVPRSVADKLMGMSAANQVLLSRQVRDQAQMNVARAQSLEFKKYGEFKLRDAADTIELWGLGEAEIGPGPRPVQPPEHRVIVFAVIDEFSTVSAAAGPQFESAKDGWDRAFAAAVAQHAKDAFVKRLPDGSLAAFRNALEAVRVARDFRRALKAINRDAPVKLLPRVALDSGLVTFDYESNAPTDVRDQPVNIAAKVCKSGLAAAGQLVLTRAVRDDAFTNLPERDEFKWVCLGRKVVPGEPEPLELWDFQDVQTQSDDRAVLLIDASKVEEATRMAPQSRERFVARLREVMNEALARRSETDPWIIPLGVSQIIAFRDGAEAVATAIELREAAFRESSQRVLWGGAFRELRNLDERDNLLRLALAAGPVRLMREDGLVRELKGNALDSARALSEAIRTGQIVVAGPLKAQVAGAFPDTQVRWKPVESTEDRPLPEEAFELRPVVKSRLDQLLDKPWKKGAAAAAVLVLVASILAFGLLGRGGGANANRAVGDVTGYITALTQTAANQRRDEVFPRLAEAFGRGLADFDKQASRMRMDLAARNEVIDKEIVPFRTLAENWAEYEERAVAAIATDEALAALRTVEDAVTFLSRLEDARIAAGPDPRRISAWNRDLDNLEIELEGLSGESVDRARGDLRQLREAIAALRALPWVEGQRARITEDSAPIVQALAEGSELRQRVAAAGAAVSEGDREKRKQDREARERVRAQELAKEVGLPPEVFTPLYAAGVSPIGLVKGAGGRAQDLVDAYLEGPGKTADAAGRLAAVQPVSAAVDALLKNAGQYDLVLADAELSPKLDALADLPALLAWFKEVEQFRRPAEPDPRQITLWNSRLNERQMKMESVGLPEADRAKVDQAKAQVQAVRDRVAAALKASWIVRDREAVAKASAAIDAELADDGPLAKAIAGLESLAAQRRKEAEEARRKELEGLQTLSQLETAARTQTAAALQAGAMSPDLAAAWKRVGEGLAGQIDAAKAAGDQDKLRAVVDQAKAWREAIDAVPAALAGAKADIPEGEGGWRQRLIAAADARRRASMARLATLAAPDAQPKALADATARQLEALTAELTTVSALAKDLDAIQDGLALGLQPGDTPPDADAPIDRLAQRVAQAVGPQPDLGEAARPVLDRLDRLRGVAGQSSVADLNRTLSSATAATPELIVAVQQRLADAALAGDPLYLDTVLDARRRLDVLPESVRAAALRAADEALPRRWAANFERLTDDAAIEGARRRADAFKIGPEAIAALRPQARFNWRRAETKRALTDANEAAAAQAARAWIDDADLWTRVPDRAPVRDALAAALGGNAAPGAGALGGEIVDPQQMGPAAAGWSFLAGESDGLRRLVYELRTDKPKVPGFRPRLEFVALTVPGFDGAGGTRTVFVSTTELPVGVAIEALAARDGGIEDFASSNANDARRTLPMSWSPRGERDLMVGTRPGSRKTNVHWIQDDRSVADSPAFYPPGADPGPPTPRHPMNYLTPRGAIFLARVTGCRLPSSAEFLAAVESDGGPGNVTDANLRDAAVSAFTAHRRSNKPTGTTDPELGMFPREDSALRSRFYPHNDGVLWFAPVDQPVNAAAAGRFRHLLGNVAEMVFDKPELLRDLPPETGAVRDVATSQAEAFGVVGGSALSAPVDAPAALLTVRKLSEGSRSATTRGFSDVGLRLAFDPVRPPPPPGDEPLLTKLERVVNDTTPLASPAASAPSGG